MELAALVVIAIVVLVGLSASNSATDQWDGCGCVLALLAAIGILIAIAGVATYGTG